MTTSTKEDPGTPLKAVGTKTPEKALRQHKTTLRKRAGLTGTMLVVGTLLVILGLSVSNQESESISIQHGLSTLRSIQAADYLHLEATMSGGRTGGNSTQFIEVYVKSSTISSMEAEELNSEDVAVFATYTSNNMTFNMTIVNGRGYYLMNNLEYDMVSGMDCIDQTDVPSISTMMTSIIQATFMDSSAPYSANVQEILDCDGGDILETNWAADDYVFCVKFDEVTQENRVTEAATDGMLVKVAYEMEDAVPSDIVTSLTNPIPDIPDMKNPNLTVSCAVLSFSEYEDAAVSALHRRYLSASSNTRASRTKWYEKDLTSHPSNTGGRRLTSSYSFYVDATTEEYDAMYSFAKYTLRCTYFCGPSEYGHERIPLADLENYVHVSDQGGATTFRRKLRSLTSSSRIASAAITLPRRCVFVHGAGVFDPDENETYELETYASYPLYFGQVHQTRPCYCSSMKFTKLDTITKEWYNTDLQLLTCRSVAARSIFSMEHNNPSIIPSHHLSIENTVLFTHYTASLTMAAAFHNEYCTLSGSSKWATIHTPIGADDVATVAAPEATLCSRSNIEALIEKFEPYRKGYDERNKWWKRQQFKKNMETILSATIAGGKTLYDVLQACTHTTARWQAGYWIEKLSSANFPENVNELYTNVQAMMVKKVDAALCGYGKYGLMQNKRFINQLTQDLITVGTEASDGATSLASCLALADLKMDVEFGNSPSDPFYSTASFQTDVTEFRDGWTGNRAKMRTWVDNLRMHKDLGGSHEYVGCYKDGWNRVLPSRRSDSNKNGPQRCQAACAAAGDFKYFGLNNKACFCGDGNLEKHGGPRPESECYKTCPDGSGSMCGGSWKLSVYKMPSHLNRAYAGCYKDASRRVFSKRLANSDTGNGLNRCQAACEAAGNYKYFGVENGRECYCGNQNVNLQKHGGPRPESECQKPCTDGSGDKCGGSWRLSVYQIPKPYADLGCVKDDANGVIEDDFTYVSTTNNGPDSCMAACIARGVGFTHFALQRGHRCYCAYAPNLFRYGARPDGDCDEPCPDGSGATCGSSHSIQRDYRFNAYAVK